MDSIFELAPTREPSLGATGFARSFPFYIQLDRHLQIIKLGRSMQKVVGPLAHKTPLHEAFRVLRPTHLNTYDDLLRNAGELCTLVSRQGKGVTFRGCMEQGEDHTLLVLVTPVLQSLTEHHELGLSFSDFAKHDASGDALLLAQTARMSAMDAERLSQRLRHRSDQLNSILELSDHGVVFFDGEQSTLHVNSALLEMLGLERANALDMRLSDLDAWLRDLSNKEAGECPSLMALRDAREPAKSLARLHLVRPRARVIHLGCAHSEDGGTVYYLRDITQETEIDRMKSEFLSSAAHEFRTPMVSIYGFVELLLIRKYPQERQADMLQTIHRQSKLLLKMINELLDLARIESRRGLDINIGSHRLDLLIDESVKGLMLTDGARQVDVGAVPDVRVLIDPEKMQRALANLLSNAFKYSSDGGSVRLQCKTQKANDKLFAVVQVCDDGIGMQPGELARAFERFYRADTSGNIPGTGLGLSLVKEIVELHQGRAELESTPGNGTTATLWIPLAPASDRVDAAVPAA